MIDFIPFLYGVLHETQMDMAMAVVTTVATVVGAAAHVVKVRILASFRIFYYCRDLYDIYTLFYIF